MNAEKLQMYIFNLLPPPSPYPTPIKIGYLPIFSGNGLLRKKMPVINGMLSFKKHWN